MFAKIKRALQRLLGHSTDPVPGAIVYGDLAMLERGESVSFGGGVILQLNASVQIGRGTMIGCGAIIHTATHDPAAHPMWAVRLDRPVEIGEFVWIGMGALIFPGVRIGDHAIVGAGAVVTRNVPSGAVVAGNPARLLRYRDPASYTDKPVDDFARVEVEIQKAGFLEESVE